MTQDAAGGAARPSRPVVLTANADAAPSSGAAVARSGFGGADPDALPGERRQPRIPRRLLAAALVALLLLAGSAYGTRAAADVAPTAFRVFDGTASAEDEQARADLAGIGAPVVGEARLLARDGEATVVVARAPAGTGARLRDSGGYPLSGGPIVADPLRSGGVLEEETVPATAEACVWVLSQRAGANGRCKSAETFAREGVSASVFSETRETVAHWSPEGELSVQVVPFGPTTLDGVRALGIPAIEQLEDLPMDDQPSRGSADPSQGPFGFGAPQIALRQIAVSEEWRMVGGVFQPEQGGGLAACVIVEPLEGSDAGVGGGCVAIPRFVATGAQGGLGIGARTVSWDWLPDGTATFDVTGP